MHSLAFKSFTLSILLHLIIFNVFIFTFPVFSESHKPMFVFLGSILQKQDISGLSLDKSISQPDAGHDRFIFTKAADKNNPFFVFLLKKPKPALSPESSHKEKGTLKPIFNAPEIVKSKKQDEKNNLSTKIQLEPYIPLKLPDK